MAIPGLRFLAFATRWFDAATVSRVFEPLIADWQREWVDGSPSHRAHIRLRGTIAFVIAALSLAPHVLLLTPPPPSMTRRVLARILIFTSVVATLLTIPILMQSREMSPLETLIAGLFVLPSGIALAFPFSMLWAADGIRRARVATPSERATALRVGLVATLFMVAFVGWGVPAMNQLYREVAAPEHIRRPLSRGVREATLGELLAKNPPPLSDVRSPANLQRERTSRALITVLPAILLWLRWGAHDARRKRWWSAPPVAIETVLVVAAYSSLSLGSFILEMLTGTPPGLTMWLPLVALIAAGMIRRVLAARVPA